MSKSVDGRTRALVEPCAREVLRGAHDPRDDAAQERLKATFDSRELACFMNDGEDKLLRK